MRQAKNFPYDATPDVHEFHHPPQSVQDVVNQWGTYNVQATSDTDDLFPLIAPGLPRSWKNMKLDRQQLDRL